MPVLRITTPGGKELVDDKRYTRLSIILKDERHWKNFGPVPLVDLSNVVFPKDLQEISVYTLRFLCWKMFMSLPFVILLFVLPIPILILVAC